MLECKAIVKWIIFWEQNILLPMVLLIWRGNTNKYIVKNKVPGER